MKTLRMMMVTMKTMMMMISVISLPMNEDISPFILYPKRCSSEGHSTWTSLEAASLSPSSYQLQFPTMYKGMEIKGKVRTHPPSVTVTKNKLNGHVSAGPFQAGVTEVPRGTHL